MKKFQISITNLSLVALLIGLMLLGVVTSSKAQQAVGINNANPDASSILDITSTTKGILIPRMTTAQRTAISMPAKGLLVFDNTDDCFYYHDGTTWKKIGGGSDNDWTADANGFSNTTANFGIGANSDFHSKLLAQTTNAGEDVGSFIINNPTSVRVGIKGITNGVGNAGFFRNTNSNTTGSSLYAMAEGNNNAIDAEAIGTATKAGSFRITNANNNDFALYAETNGKGTAVYGLSTGSANAGYFISTSPISTTASLYSTHEGAGDAFRADSRSASTGRAGYFTSSNPLTFNPTLEVDGKTSGDAIHVKSTNGRAGYFEITNALNNNDGLWSITKGTGPAGRFHIFNTSNSSPAMVLFTNGTGVGLFTNIIGTGRAGVFEINNNLNNSIALTAKTRGTGTAARFEIDNASNLTPALYATTNGTGVAAEFAQGIKIGNTSNSLAGNMRWDGTDFQGYDGSNWKSMTKSNVWVSDAHGYSNTTSANFGIGTFSLSDTKLKVEQTGMGSVGLFEIDNSSNFSAALSALSNGTGDAIVGFKSGTSGAAGDFQINNAANASHALNTTTNGVGNAFYCANNGTGRAAYFLIGNTSSNSNAIDAQTNGLRSAGTFTINNASNSRSAIVAETNGTGLAGNFIGGNLKVEGNGAKRLIVQSDDNNEATLDLLNSGAGTDWRINSTSGNVLRFEKSINHLTTVTNVLDLVALVATNRLEPSTDLAVQLGSGSFRYTAVYAQNGTIQTSDINFKKNIKDLCYGLDAVMKMRPVSFDWKNTEQEKSNLGFIAQDIEQIVPEVIVKEKPQNKDGSIKEGAELYGMKYSELIPVLVKAIQEQQAIIENLEKEVKALKE